MNTVVKNLHGVSGADSGAKPCDKKTFSVVETNTPELASFSSSAKQSPYPYLTSKASKHRHRQVHMLKPPQVENLHLADEHAAKIGLPLNTFLTVSWLLTEHPEINSVAFTKCLKRIGAWLARHGVPHTYCYVHENPCSPIEGDTKPNTHILLHIPKRLMAGFKAKAPDWFDATLDGGVLVEPRTKANYRGLDRLQYMCKGADGFTARRYGGYRKPGGQGVIWSKRSGVSQNLGWKARGAFREKSAHKHKAGAS